MATVTVYPTSYSIGSGTWNNPTYIYADDGSYTTTTVSAFDNHHTIEYNFPSANIPAGATINSVTLQTQWKASSSAAQLSSKIQMGYDGSLVGSANTDEASTTSDRTQNCTTTGTWTVEQLNSGLAYARITAYLDNLFASGTCSFDYLCIIVDYTEGSGGTESTKELTANTSITANADKKAKKVLFKTVSAGALFIASFLSGGEEYFKELIASVAASALFTRKTGKIIRTAAIKITAYVRFPFKIIRYVLLSWIIRDKQLTTVLRAKDLSHKEREKQLNTAERAKELEIKERKIDLEVME